MYSHYRVMTYHKIVSFLGSETIVKDSKLKEFGPNIITNFNIYLMFNFTILLIFSPYINLRL